MISTLVILYLHIPKNNLQTKNSIISSLLTFIQFDNELKLFQLAVSDVRIFSEFFWR